LKQIDNENDFNFLEVKTGNIQSGILYRSSSPITGGFDKEIKEKLAIKANINCIINLVNNHSVAANLSKEIIWYNKLLLDGKVICLPMTLTVTSKFNEKKIKKAMLFMINQKGPYLIHCFAGIDRTGFFIMLLESLMGASIKEIISTYLSAFSIEGNVSDNLENHYKVSGFLGQMKQIFHAENIFNINIQSAVEQYLLHNIGLSQDELKNLQNILKCKN